MYWQNPSSSSATLTFASSLPPRSLSNLAREARACALEKLNDATDSRLSTRAACSEQDTDSSPLISPLR